MSNDCVIDLHIVYNKSLFLLSLYFQKVDPMHLI